MPDGAEYDDAFPMMRATFVEASENADYTAVVVTLFRRVDDPGRICGWYLGPVETVQGRLGVPYLPRSHQMAGMVAILLAYQAATARGLGVCVVDPEGLWSQLGGV